MSSQIENEITRTIAMVRVETDEYVRFSLVDHLDALLEVVRNKVSAIEICAEGEFVKPDSKGTQYLESLERMDVHHKNSALTQRKIQSVIDRGEYRKMKAATVLVSESGHAAIVSKGGAFYWVDNEALPFEYRLAGEGDEIN